MRQLLLLILLLILIPSAAAQDEATSAGTLVLGMGFVVLILLVGLLIRVMLIKQPAEPIPVSLPPKPQEPPIDEGRVYGELAVVDGLSSRSRILITKQIFSIGRGLDNNDYELNLPGISRQHIILRLDANDNRMYITDLASANGTLVNGKALNPNEPHPLYNGDEISLSHVILRWKSLHGVETQERLAAPKAEDRRTKAIPLPDKEKPDEQW